MTTRREVLPLLAGAAGAVSVGCTSTQPSPTEPELRRVSYTSQHTGTERDYFVSSVPLRQMYPLLNRLESLGHDQVRFTVHEDLGHFAWIRVYGGQDVYDWMLAHTKA